MAWMFFGPVKCPNCDSPIDTDTTICPICSTAAPMRGPWNNHGWLAWTIGGVILLIALSDMFLGTHIGASIRQAFAQQ